MRCENVFFRVVVITTTQCSPDLLSQQNTLYDINKIFSVKEDISDIQFFTCITIITNKIDGLPANMNAQKSPCMKTTNVLLTFN